MLVNQIISQNACFWNIPNYKPKIKRRRKIMNNFDLELKSIQLQNEKLLREMEVLHQLLEAVQPQSETQKEYYTVEDCAEMKSGAALNTYKTNRFLLPGCGNPRYSAYIAGRLCFPREEVMKWLKISDAEYLDYAKECGVTVVPEKYLRLSQKAKEKKGVAV